MVSRVPFTNSINPLVRKEKAIGGAFAFRFTWSQALDIAADVYHGVSFNPASCFLWLLIYSSSFSGQSSPVSAFWFGVSQFET